MWQGVVGRSRIEGIVSPAYTVITPCKDIEPTYAEYLLKLPALIQKFHQNSQGMVDDTLNLKFINFSQIVVKLPPLAEQQKIAEILTTVDEVIENTEAEISKLEDLKKATMNEVLTKGIGHTEFKETEIGRIPKSWEVENIGNCCAIYDSKRVPLNSEERQRRKGRYPYYGANNIQDYIDSYIFDFDSVLIAEDGGYFEDYSTRAIAQHAVARYWVNNHAHVLCGDSRVTNRWLYYFMVHRNILKFINGGTRSKLNQSDLINIPIAIPSISEQQKVAAILDSQAKQILTCDEKVNAIRRLKLSLSGDLLTGKVRVKVN
jgi:type I restriction enzyme S subunit